MGSQKYYTPDDIYLSNVYGQGAYLLVDTKEDPVAEVLQQSMIFKNIITNEMFYARRLNTDSEIVKRHYKDLVLNPPNKSCAWWPVDLIHIDPEQTKSGRAFVQNKYTEDPNIVQIENTRQELAVLFPYKAKSKNISSVATKLKHMENFNWKNKEVIQLAIKMVELIDNLNQSNYSYTDFDLRRFLIDADGKMTLDFSNLIFGYRELSSGSSYCVMQAGDYPIEFAESSMVNGNKTKVDMKTQNYSLCAMLFYMLFGRYAYEGRLLSGYPDDDLQNHYIKFRDYHNVAAYFIFDPNDDQNRIGAFGNEQIVVDLWEKIPNVYKDYFIKTLCIGLDDEYTYPTPKSWIEFLNYLERIDSL